MKLLVLTLLLLTGCSGLVLSPPVDHGVGVIWMDPMYERGQVPSEYQLGIRILDGVVIARTNSQPANYE